MSLYLKLHDYISGIFQDLIGLVQLSEVPLNAYCVGRFHCAALFKAALFRHHTAGVRHVLNPDFQVTTFRSESDLISPKI